ncbi:cystathionine beta-synthase [Sporolactobacillus inulinus]|uniref:Cystathionine beta-synthase n=1 Tax=Sporolactobacillus inulinus TaxID=2078 RepID=A0A4Y1ZBL0_9BACL|nr:cystathionine beta-synthase [Sporolactobacillus inulinus]
MAVYDNVHELVGRTPLVALHAFPLPKGVRLYAKCEYFNPGGSVKDRLGETIIREAMHSGKLKPGGTLIEPTAGNTGIGLALAAVGKGIDVLFCVPEKFSVEKQTLMKALGARVIKTPSDQGMAGAIKKAKELEQSIKNSYCPNQFANPNNPKTYFETLGPELWEDLHGSLDVLVAGAGSGGTFTGTADYLKKRNPKIKTVVVEPVGSILNGGARWNIELRELAWNSFLLSSKPSILMKFIQYLMKMHSNDSKKRLLLKAYSLAVHRDRRFTRLCSRRKKRNQGQRLSLFSLIPVNAILVNASMNLKY